MNSSISIPLPTYSCVWADKDILKKTLHAFHSIDYDQLDIEAIADLLMLVNNSVSFFLYSAAYREIRIGMTSAVREASNEIVDKFGFMFYWWWTAQFQYHCRHSHVCEQTRTKLKKTIQAFHSIDYDQLDIKAIADLRMCVNYSMSFFLYRAAKHEITLRSEVSLFTTRTDMRANPKGFLTLYHESFLTYTRQKWRCSRVLSKGRSQNHMGS